MSRGYEGTGRTVPSEPETAAEVWELVSKKPVSAPIGIESIIGADDRTRVRRTTRFPSRAVALITFSSGRCSGWMISPDTVATAGHCVHRGGGGSGGFYPIRSFRVFPGRNGPAAPFGSCGAKRLYTVKGWSHASLEFVDYGAIKLNCNVGNRTGWFGFFWTSGSLKEFPALHAGYPGDKPLTQWRAADFVRTSLPFQLFYDFDTQGGQSGGPAYFNRSDCNGPCGMAIHAYGLHGIGQHKVHNHGTRINEAVFKNLVRWRSAS
jgi:glutamyl endopeptidase